MPKIPEDQERALRVGIISVVDSTKGLWRDAETLVWMLRHEPVRPGGKTVDSIQIFCFDGPMTAAKPFSGATVEGAEIVPEGVAIADFVESVDVIVSCEILIPHLLNIVLQSNKRFIYVPNLDWANLGDRMDQWIMALRTRPWIQVWAKQVSIQKALASVGIESIYVPWSIPDPVVRSRDARNGDTVRLFLNAGNGGYQGRRGVDVALAAFVAAKKRCDRLRLTLKTIKPVSEYAPFVQHLLDDVEVIEGFYERHIIDKLMREADAVVHVSRWEGFGIPALEALHAGVPVIATDGWPVGDLVEHGHNGLLVKAKHQGRRNMTPHWEVSVDDLADKMVQIADFELRERLTCPTPSELVSRQHAFLLRGRASILNESDPRMTLVHSPHNVQSRRSEKYWQDAFESHGYDVECVSWSDHDGTGLGADSDFVLVGKSPVDFVKNVRPTARILALWHHDSPEYIASWFGEVSSLADVCFVPYLPANNKHVMLHPGPRSTGDRGPGKRAIQRDRSESDDVVFIGVRSHERADLVGHIARNTKLACYGPGMDRGPAWDNKADAVYCHSKVSLSISRHKGVGRVLGYTSNRLFHATAVGAFVVAEAFPGIVELYPDGIATFSTREEAITVIDEALSDDEGRRKKAAIASNITWRNHTWNDRVHQLLRELTDRCGGVSVGDAISKSVPGPNNEPSWRSYWQARASKHGGRSIVPVAWTADRFAKETERLWSFVKAHAGVALEGRAGNLLDYGCGVGRFSTRLANEYEYTVTGVDMSPAMVRMAHNAGAEAALLSVGGSVPFDDNTFDALYSCTVLQHVPDGEIEKVAAEIRRTLMPGALVVLVENTSSKFGRTSRSGHVVFRTDDDYVKLFPGVDPVAGIEIDGEHHQLFLGRLR